MQQSSKKRLQAIRTLRRNFWIGEISWDAALLVLRNEYKMSYDESMSFLGDSTNLDPQAKLQASLVAIPFGVSLVQPSIML